MLLLYMLNVTRTPEEVMRLKEPIEVSFVLPYLHSLR